MVDHYLDTTLDVADVLHMHADNCVGQNKNNTTIAYPVWRTLTGLSMRLELSFMSFGHTRCTVDGYFGLPKTKVRNSDIGTMTQVVAAVEVSSHVNEAQVFDWQWREWDAFLMRFITPIRGITKFHHFRVENTEPGMVYMKESVHEVEQVFCILKEGVSVEEVINAGILPQLQQGGISNQRCAYLEKEIQQHMAGDVSPP